MVAHPAGYMAAKRSRFSKQDFFIPIAAISAIDYQFEGVFLAGPKDMLFVVTGITHVAASFDAARHPLSRR